MKNSRRKRVLAVSSGGGHWSQLLRVRPAFKSHDVVYVTVDRDYHRDVPSASLHTIRDANINTKFALVVQLLQIFYLVMLYRPDVVLSTGAAPGYFAIRVGKLFGARTIWIDSIANGGELSLSGKQVRKYADLWLTQWEHLADPESGLSYGGSVI